MKLSKHNRNLTFSLAPWWAFVETEDQRKDWGCKGSGYGGDPSQPSFFHPFETLSIFCKLMKYVFYIDGRVYIKKTWLGPRPVPYASGGGSVVTRCWR